LTTVLKKYRDAKLFITKQLDLFSRVFEGRPTEMVTAEAAIRRHKILAHYTYNFIFSFLAALTLTESTQDNFHVMVLRPGDIAESDIVSPISADIEPQSASRTRKAELERNIPPVFDYDDAAVETWLRRWETGFKTVRREYFLTKTSRRNPQLAEDVSARLFEITGQTLSPRYVDYLMKLRFSEDAERSFSELGRQLLGRLISPSNLFPIYYNTGIQVRLVNQSMRETQIHDVSRIWSLDQAREYLNYIPGSTRRERSVQAVSMVDVINSVLIANLKFNQSITEKRVAKALLTAKYTPYSVKKGQVIVQRGERLTNEQVEIIRNLKDLTSKKSSIKRFFLSLLLLFVFFSVLFRLNITGRAFWNLTLKDALVFLMITITSFLAVKHALPLLRALFAPLNMGFGVEYLMPISAGAIIIHLMMGKETAFTYATLSSIVIGYLLEQNFYFTVYSFAVMASAIQSIRSCKQRTDLYRCGAWSGLVGALLVLSFSLSRSIGFLSVDWTAMIITVGLAFLSGLLGAIITSSMIPIFEAVFGYTTSLKLLELSNFNHPLLHSLMMKAPGTYHHSVIVGSLAELAADRIKANSLLARVSSYYHDIGKMNKPMYFIENQTPNNNPHDALQPSMSVKILFSHVKDGVKLGREHNLGTQITGIIEQHHGTTLVSYFFNKAKKNEKPELDPVNENHFHYPGPRPQTREAAIVMLADACEAATRSIAEPTAAKIQTMVHNIITRRFLEEQFAECDLTLKDLRIAEECFVRTLVSLYHHRIQYPNQPPGIHRPAGNNNGAPAATPLKKVQ